MSDVARVETNAISPPQRPRRLDEMTIEQRADTCRRWWDQQAEYVLVLHAVGRDTEQIAAYLGIHVADVETILFPRTCNRGPDQFREAFKGDASALSIAYCATVNSLIHGSLAMIAASAAQHAEREGMGNCAAPLAAVARSHRKMADSLRARGLGSLSWGDGRSEMEILLVAHGEYRVALGIETDPEQIKRYGYPSIIGRLLDAVESVERVYPKGTRRLALLDAACTWRLMFCGAPVDLNGVENQ